MVNKTNIDTLITYLKTIDAKKFDMGSWFDAVDEDGEGGFLFRLDPDTANVEMCGTTACLAGYAAHLFERPTWDAFVHRLIEFHKGGVSCVYNDLWTDGDGLDCKTYNPQNIGMRVLGLTCEQSSGLFLSHGDAWIEVFGYDEMSKPEWSPTLDKAIKVLEYVRDNW